MIRRQDKHNEDPIEELKEVYDDVKIIEADLAKTINITTFVINKYNSCTAELHEIKKELNHNEVSIQSLKE